MSAAKPRVRNANATELFELAVQAFVKSYDRRKPYLARREAYRIALPVLSDENVLQFKRMLDAKELELKRGSDEASN